MLQYKTRASTDFIIVHTSRTPVSSDIGVQELRKQAKAKGYFDIGYHFVIRRDGTVEPGRDVAVCGTHASGLNDRSVGICLIGGVNDTSEPEYNYTPEQAATLASLIRQLQESYPTAAVEDRTT